MPEPAVTIRPATRDDMRAVGRLGALLVRLHHDFDPQRFMAATSGTEHGYGSFLRTMIEMTRELGAASED